MRPRQTLMRLWPVTTDLDQRIFFGGCGAGIPIRIPFIKLAGVKNDSYQKSVRMDQ